MSRSRLRFAALAAAVSAFALTPLAGADPDAPVVAADPVAAVDPATTDPAATAEPAATTHPAAATTEPAAATAAPVATTEPEPVATTSASTLTGYQVTLTGPVSADVGEPTGYSATCGGGYPCPFGEFRAFGSVINRLGEGFGRGATGTYSFRAAGTYAIRYRVGASCPGSPRLACPIDVWIYTVVSSPGA